MIFGLIMPHNALGLKSPPQDLNPHTGQTAPLTMIQPPTLSSSSVEEDLTSKDLTLLTSSIGRPKYGLS